MEIDATFEWETALGVATREEHKEIIHLLLVKGADPNITYALLDAVGRGREDIARMLLDAGADPSIEEYEMHTTALMLAVKLRMKDIVALLLEFGANPDATDSLVDTALDMAEGEEIIAILKQAGALHAAELME